MKIETCQIKTLPSKILKPEQLLQLCIYEKSDKTTVNKKIKVELATKRLKILILITLTTIKNTLLIQNFYLKQLF